MGRIEPRPKDVNDKILAREFVLEKTLDGKESLKITIKSSKTRWGGARKFLIRRESACGPGTTGQTGLSNRLDRSNLGFTLKYQAQVPESWILQRRMNKRYKEELQTKNPPLVNC